MIAAIIDSGIRESEHIRITDRIDFLTGSDKTGQEDGQACIHGTTCAKIIAEICPKVRFLDLTAVCPDGRAPVSALLEALDWCIWKQVKLIHMSIGSIHYFDIRPMKTRIKQLTGQGAILVAAYHNRNIRTYPAAFPKVFGVRQDREGNLANGQFLFQEQDRLGKENCLVAHWWDGGDYANSYAAPVITGYAAKALCQNPALDFEGVLARLEQHAVSDVIYSEQIADVLRENYEEIEIPVIAGISLCPGDMGKITQSFAGKEYEYVLLQDSTAKPGGIPLEHYGGRETSLNRILSTVNRIYEPDVILAEFSGEYKTGAEETSAIDMWISYGGDGYTIEARHLFCRKKVIEEVCDIIFRYFL